MKLNVSVIIPIYNERKALPELVKRVFSALNKTKKTFEVILVDDHSTDSSMLYLNSLKINNLVVLTKKGKKGKAYSLAEGITFARGENIAMIDGDLQYPPEDIPLMLKKLEDADIVVANRKHSYESLLRKAASKGFRNVFGKNLFGLTVDIQSGLKVFKKKIYEIVSVPPKSGWSFDLEFLHRANQAGFSIVSHDITFQKRQDDSSKVSVLTTAAELGVQATRVRLKKVYPMHTAPTTEGIMKGAGVYFKKKKYVTHTTLPHNISALRTFELKQKVIILGLLSMLVFGLVLKPYLTGLLFIAFLSILYFIDTIFNFFVVMKSLRSNQEISSTQNELKNLSDKTLPVYTILCPLYKEAHILPQFLKAIAKLDWPKNKLDVLLLLEEDDKYSIEIASKMDLPSYVRVVIVPESQPKTKPKACNYGLALAKGEYLVIYDAEDIPDPLQLKKAYLAFNKVSAKVVCLQAKLNYFNPHQNLLTRFFTAEYSLWFDVSLVGLQSIGSIMPLGGTSNHFRTVDLHKLQGWDPFNVTEDADLGMRLFKKGYQTAMIDSVTLEEANSNTKNWIRQRSRWIKGYMQTYLVHLRDIVTFSRERGRHALVFHLVLGGKILFILINPLLWITTVAYFTLRATVGPTIESLFPTWVFYMAGTSLVFGNFLFLYYYMIGCLKRGHYSLVKYIFLVPIYWLLISISGFMAFYQLLFKPHYWEKTVHGLHLKKQSDRVELTVEIKSDSKKEQPPRRSWNFGKEYIAKIRSRKTLMGGSALLFATILANFLNFFFNAYLGRVLDFDDFAEISLVASFSYLSILISKGFGTAVTYKSGYLTGKANHQASYSYWKYMRGKAFLASLVLTFIWLVLSPFLSVYFDSAGISLFLLFGMVLLVGFAQAVDQAYLSGKLLFGLLATIAIFEPILKNALAFSAVFLHLNQYAYAIVPITTIMMFLFGWVVVIFATRKERKTFVNKANHNEFPFKLFTSSLFLGVSSLSFLSFDIILANHFLPSQQAGQYALISLVGKMVYFLGNLGSIFITPLVSHYEGANKGTARVLNLSVLATSVLSLIGLGAFGFFGNITVPFLYGDKANVIVPFLLVFTAGMAAFTISKVITAYYLIKKVYTLPIISLILTILQVVLVFKFHSSISDIVIIMCVIGLLNLIAAVVVHSLVKYVKVFESNIADFFGLFTNIERRPVTSDKGYAILIFNWRDTKHRWAGGAEVYVHEMAKRWVKDGHSVTLFCGNDGRSPRNQTIDGIRVIRRGGFFTVYIWAVLYYFFRFRKNYDIIVDSENGIPFFTPLFSTRPIVLLIHHVHQEVFRKSLRWPFSSFAAMLEADLMPLVYKNRQVVTVSPSSKTEILKHKLTAKDPIVIYNGIDLLLYKKGIKNINPVVLYVGRLQQYKSLHVFLKAAKTVLEKNPYVEFIIAGEGEDRQNLEKLSKKLGLSNNVTFAGFVSPKEKVKLFQKAWVFVNPSLMEGWGITTIEANAAGTPVIASDVPGLRDSIIHNQTGMLVRYGDYKAFAQEIESILMSSKKRTKMSNQAVKWAKNFSWDKSSAIFSNVIAEQIDEQKEVSRIKKVYYVFNRVTSLF